MNVLERHLKDYLELRRGLGFDLGRAESRLLSFIAFLKNKRATRITTKLSLEFVFQFEDRSPSTQCGYFSAIRGFARYLTGFDSRTEVPPLGLVRRGYRPQPYIYSDEEIVRILTAAREHPSTPRYALKPHTLHCLLGLLTVTGMRLMEALHLKPDDIDWVQGVLTIGRAKFQQSRLVPLHQSTLEALQNYIKHRNDFFAERPWIQPAEQIFVSTLGTAFSGRDVGEDYRKLTRRIGIRQMGSSRGPRLHDLRHRFAVSTLLRWYRRDENIDRLLPVLSTYLGHLFISGTYWYLTCTPELMEAAATRLEKRWEGESHE